jgi:hypothetical protein
MECKNTGKTRGLESSEGATTRGQQEEGKAQTEMGGRSGRRSEENRTKRMKKDGGG